VVSSDVLQSLNSESTGIVILPNVTSFGFYAFSSCTAIKYVTLQSVTSIKGGVFADCTSLVSVDLPSVGTIEDYAFERCTSMTTLKLTSDSNVKKSFTVKAFPNNSAKDITLYLHSDYKVYNSMTEFSDVTFKKIIAG
jgi:hypothetical protein